MTVQYPDRRVRKTKEWLKTSLLALIEEKPFHHITITELVQRADCTRATFYAHYDQLERLLDEIITEAFEAMTTAFRMPYAGQKAVRFDQMPSNAVVLFNHFLAYRTFYKLMLGPHINYNFREKLTKHLDQLYRQEFDLVVSESDKPLDLKYFSTYRIHGIIGLILTWIDEDFKESPDFMSQQLIQVLKFSTPGFYVRT
ncbi:TetR family transcriptional regulator [Paenibacillus cellulosilyticus]|uniref:TetR family transcriptional regulator n=1 Tax=Paenibacillus cellulosilyticus TaxID=375489 RepID=A0A2V2Z0Q0_9BACL|nr:TetR-like C-terminal domain-containing protein [Paenibacillus cellulosilyticus]PWW08644.1 TetR family transcriptional regulator [Paenibacillus cellulosilyticus]QKS48209.1 TetR/AcrR family transcriptional regulator [Paenibacillus cellulosilyticus]